MTRPLTSSRLLLLADPRPAASPDAATPVRRYRLARIRIQTREEDPGLRFEHLGRVFD